MDTKPTYTKFHNFHQGTIAYTVSHPLLTETKMYVETHRTVNGWIAYETYDEQTAVGGDTREKAVAEILKQAEYVARGLRLQDAWNAKEEELTSGSTAWNALYAGRENADDTVGEGNVTDNSTEYWELAWSGYESLMDELEAADRILAKTYNLEDLPVCNWCSNRTDDGKPINGDELFCPTCLPIATLSNEWDALDEREQASRDAKRAAHEHADKTVDDFNPKRWFEVALARYTELTGAATSVAEVAQDQVAAPDGLEMFVGEDEHNQVHVRIVGTNAGYAWLRAAAAARKWTGGCKVQQVSSSSAPEGLRFVFEYEV
jgi:hypothetical protein